MWRLKSLMIAAPIVAGLLAAPAAHAEWRGHGGYGHYYGHYNGGWRGPGVAGAILGLGAAAIVGGVIASQAYAPPPVVYAAPRPYYAPPPAYYAPAPGYYAPPPAYYPPGY
jgi:hypothetical protein